MINKLKEILVNLILAILTEDVMKRIVLLVLKRIAAKTQNKVDDELVKIVEEAWK